MDKCRSCDDAMINGVHCHETGCPDAWRDELRECRWCGQTFKPGNRTQFFCCQGCADSFNS